MHRACDPNTLTSSDTGTETASALGSNGNIGGWRQSSYEEMVGASVPAKSLHRWVLSTCVPIWMRREAGLTICCSWTVTSAVRLLLIAFGGVMGLSAAQTPLLQKFTCYETMLYGLVIGTLVQFTVIELLSMGVQLGTVGLSFTRLVVTGVHMQLDAVKTVGTRLWNGQPPLSSRILYGLLCHTGRKGQHHNHRPGGCARSGYAIHCATKWTIQQGKSFMTELYVLWWLGPMAIGKGHAILPIAKMIAQHWWKDAAQLCTAWRDRFVTLLLAGAIWTALALMQIGLLGHLFSCVLGARWCAAVARLLLRALYLDLRCNFISIEENGPIEHTLHCGEGGRVERPATTALPTANIVESGPIGHTLHCGDGGRVERRAAVALPAAALADASKPATARRRGLARQRSRHAPTGRHSTILALACCCLLTMANATHTKGETTAESVEGAALAGGLVLSAIAMDAADNSGHAVPIPPVAELSVAPPEFQNRSELGQARTPGQGLRVLALCTTQRLELLRVRLSLMQLAATEPLQLSEVQETGCRNQART